MVLPLLQQSVMFFNIAFSKLVLKKDLAWQQYVGAIAVVAGVCIAALPEDGGTSIFAGVGVLCHYFFSLALSCQHSTHSNECVTAIVVGCSVAAQPEGGGTSTYAGVNSISKAP